MGKQFHGRQAGIGIHEKLLDVRKIGDPFAVKVPLTGVVEGLVSSIIGHL
jgi:hypothetical protein